MMSVPAWQESPDAETEDMFEELLPVNVEELNQAMFKPLAEVISEIRSELLSESPSVERLLVLSESIQETLASTLKHWEEFVSQGVADRSTLDATIRDDELAQLMRNVTNTIRSKIGVPSDAGPHATDNSAFVDSSNRTDEMSATTDKDYIDSRLETIATRLEGSLKVQDGKVDARLGAVEQTLTSGIKSIQDEIGTRFALFDSTLHKNQSDILKWVIGVIIAASTAGVSIMSFLLTNSKPPSSPAPIVIVAERPASAAAIAVPAVPSQATPRAAQRSPANTGP